MVNDKCKDCANLSCRDVFSGVCVLSNKPVKLNDNVCKDFLRTNKCKYCAKYKQSKDNENLGSCDGTMVYPDLTGCEDFVK